MNEIEKVETKPLARAETQSEVESLIRVALDKGLNPTELYAILREERAARAEQAFNAAFAQFKAECPPIRKRTENTQFVVTRNGVKRPARYAALEDIDADTREPLTRNGLSYSWGDAAVSGDSITMTCWVAHIGGYKRPASVTMPHESRAGSSPQQKYASTITYLQRYSLISALGLTTCDEDDDGAGGATESIADDQARTLNDLIVEVGDSRGKPIDRAAFLKIFKADKLGDIPASRYDEAVAKLEAQRKGKP